MLHSMLSPSLLLYLHFNVCCLMLFLLHCAHQSTMLISHLFELCPEQLFWPISFSTLLSGMFSELYCAISFQGE